MFRLRVEDCPPGLRPRRAAQAARHDSEALVGPGHNKLLELIFLFSSQAHLVHHLARGVDLLHHLHSAGLTTLSWLLTQALLHYLRHNLASTLIGGIINHHRQCLMTPDLLLYLQRHLSQLSRGHGDCPAPAPSTGHRGSGHNLSTGADLIKQGMSAWKLANKYTTSYVFRPSYSKPRM